MSAPTVIELERDPSAPIPSPRRGSVVAIATWSARHRWLALLLWVAFVAIAVVGGGAVGGADLDEASMTIGASGAADTALHDADFDDVPSESILVQRVDGGTLDASASEDVLSEVTAAVPGVVSVGEPVESSDGGSLLVEVSLVEVDGDGNEQDEASAEIAGEVSAAVAAVASGHPDL